MSATPESEAESHDGKVLVAYQYTLAHVLGPMTSRDSTPNATQHAGKLEAGGTNPPRL